MAKLKRRVPVGGCWASRDTVVTTTMMMSEICHEMKPLETCVGLSILKPEMKPSPLF